MDYKIVNKTLYLCDKWGNLGRSISENVAFGTFDESTSMFLVTKNDGRVELNDINGLVRRVISKEGVEARFQGANILVRTKSGKNLVVDRDGNIQRII